MKKKHVFLEKRHQLLEPIELDDKPVTSVTVKPWSAKANIDLLPKGDKLTFDEMCALIEAGTGLNQEQIEDLTTQDFNSIFADVHGYYIHTGYTLADPRSDDEKFKQRQDTSRYEQDASNNKVVLFFSDEREVMLKRPKIKITKLAEQFDTLIEQRIFILTQISGLSQDEVENLPLPDYRSLNEVVSHFLSSKAA